MLPKCRPDFMWLKDTGRCVDCPLGCYGPECIYKCPYPSFGRRCLDGVCNCSREICNISTACISVEAKDSTILTTQLGNSFQPRGHSNNKDSTINEDSGILLTNFPTTDFTKGRREEVKPNLRNSDRNIKSEDGFYEKPRKHRHTNYVSVILITFFGTSVSVLLIVAVEYQIWSKMYRNREQKPRHLSVTSDPEQRGIYNEISNVKN
ncbi:uncharacterized protein LOC125648755 [Ostrea edulis]|uniref:uncharacterized protein LOC130046598 n=1 Tax=Ostrea edulis TaxID=37623 RepID=UPI0024AF0736|nr:uncharacterized protein LOC130046598 [Ostrea edulis]XP_056010702.1 uncharacterized protein LOC125648755 [Ostrea edulis]